MSINLSNSLVGLSILSNTNSFADMSVSQAPIMSNAARKAMAQFTAEVTTPPWKEPAVSTSATAQIAAIKQMASIIDATVPDADPAKRDIQTSFTTYKALAKLQLLAETAAKATTTTAERMAIQKTFAQGLGDLQTYLGQAGSDKINLAFGTSTRRAESVAISASKPIVAAGKGVAEARTDALPGLTGTEKFTIRLDRNGSSDTVAVDLAGTPQPPTLDSVSAAFNAAIAAVPARDADGNIVLDADGKTTPRWSVSFAATKSSGEWGLAMTSANPSTRVALDQVGAKDALIVASGAAASGVTGATSISRIDDAAGAMTAEALGTIAGIDRDATERAKLTATPPVKVPGLTPPPTLDALAPTVAQAIVTDASGASYVVGTTSGDLGSNLQDGKQDLFLTKLDSEGGVVWQRSLGATGSAEGAAITLTADGGVVVAGTVNSGLDGQGTDADMLVSRYDAAGDEKFTTVVRSFGADRASAIAVGADGSIFVGGKATSDGGDAFVVRLGATGVIAERRKIDDGGSEAVKSLAIGQDGNLLALISHNGTAELRKIDATSLTSDLGSLSLGTADARAIAVAADGTIAVVGSTRTAIAGAQVNAMGGGSDGFVSRIDAGLAGAATSYVGTAADDQLDSAAFMNGSLYIGGRTNGDFGSGRKGLVDGFVTRLDAATGAVESSTQFGKPTLVTAPVRIAMASGGDTALSAIGLHRGEFNPAASVKLTAQTSLRAGDEFSIRVEGGRLAKIVINADDTVTSLADRIRKITGTKATVTAAKSGSALVLRIEATAAASIELVAGATGKDALAKLGIEPERLSVPEAGTANGPKVRPGGTFSLALSEALNLTTAEAATASLKLIQSAVSTTQTAYRSLYWDDSKEALANGTPAGSSAVSAYQNARLADYQDALRRLTALTV